MKNYKYYSIITGVFVASLLISNILDSKIFILMGITLPTGIIIFPIVYLFGDIFTEVYGYKASRTAIWTGFFSLLMAIVFFKIAEMIEPAPFWHHQEDFKNILGKLPRIAAASVLAYFCGEFANSVVLSKLKVKMKGKGMSFRFILSTLFGQAVDTLIFIIVAFAGVVPFSALIVMFLSGWAFKVLWEIIALPITIPVVKWLKRVEGEDHFDDHVDYNPFKLN